MLQKLDLVSINIKIGRMLQKKDLSASPVSLNLLFPFFHPGHSTRNRVRISHLRQKHVNLDLISSSLIID